MEDELERIIKATEIVILPEGRSIEEFLTGSSSSAPKENLSSFADRLNQISADYGATICDESSSPLRELDAFEDFEAEYLKTKSQINSMEIAAPQDYSYLLEDLAASSLYSLTPQEQDAEKALALNEVFKTKLTSFNSTLQRLLTRVNEKFRVNNMFLEVSRSERHDSQQPKRTYSKCGSPFFKDAHGDPCPSNEDYRYRKNVLREFFPFDQPETRIKWQTKEKVNLIQGVRQQMINHIVSEQSKKLCQDSSKRTRCQLQKLKFITNNRDLQTASFASLAKTIQESFPDFSINWNIISFGDLNSTHSVSECMGMWFSYLNPDINRNAFSEAETQIIMNAVNNDTYESWQDIAASLDNRSALQAFLKHTSICMKLCSVHVRWSPQEDQLLLDSVDRYCVGPQKTINWTKIGQDFPMRNKTQCYNRYLVIGKYRKTKVGSFSHEENRIILDFITMHGEVNLSKIPPHYLPGRSMVQIRNHYNLSLKNVDSVKPWTRDEDKQLMEFVEKNGCDFAKFASSIKTHTRISCRTRYQTIKKFLDKNPKKTVADVPSRAKTTMKKARVVDGNDSDNSAAEVFTIIEVDDDTVDSAEPKDSVFHRAIARMKRDNYELYSMFVTCFNLNFKPTKPTAVNISDTITLLNMLRVLPQDLRYFRKVACTKDQIVNIERLKQSYQYANQSIISKNVMVPPCFSAAAGLRAVYVKIKDCPEPSKKSITKSTTENYKKNLEDFQKRFMSLFYWSAVASRLKLDELQHLDFPRNPAGAVELLIAKKEKISKRS